MKRDLRFYLRLVLLIALSLVVLFPLVYLFSSSLFTQKDFNRTRLFTTTPAFSNYMKALGHRYFTTYIINSVGTSLLSGFIRTLIVILAAFTFTHLEFPGKKLFLAALTLTLFVPQEAILYQNYRTVSSMSLLDSWVGIILPSLFSAAQMLLLIGSFKAQGRDTYDAARIDGAGDLTYMSRVLVPLSGPAVLTVLVQTLITTFNSYLWPLLVTNKAKTRTIQIGITMLGFAESGETGAQMAAIAMVTLPFLLVLLVTKSRIENALIKK